MTKLPNYGFTSRRKPADRARSRADRNWLQREAKATAAVTVALMAGSVYAMGIPSHGYLLHNLFSDDTIKIPADIQDKSLVNPWGSAFIPGAAFWTNDNATGMSAFYFGNGESPGNDNPALAAIVPTPPGDSSPSTPTGIVANTTGSFKLKTLNTNPVAFIFATEHGTISAWNGAVGFPGPAELEVDNSADTCPNGTTGSVYKGFAQGATKAGLFLCHELLLRHDRRA